METRTDLLKYIVEKKKPEKYLEIGIQHGLNFDAINVIDKTGVEPFPKRIQENVLTMFSNQFFESKKNTGAKYDLIFIDGLHTEEQTWEDLKNSLDFLSENGIIVMHDALPHNEEYTSMSWCGTSYKAIMRAAQTNGLLVKTWEKDHGCAVIVKDPDPILQADVYTTEFEDLWKNDGAIVGKCTTEEIKKFIDFL